MRPSGRKAIRQGSSKVATVVIVKGRLATGFCSPALTWAQAARGVKARSQAAFANFIVVSPYFQYRRELFGDGIDTASPAPRSAIKSVAGRFDCGDACLISIHRDS